MKKFLISLLSIIMLLASVSPVIEVYANSTEVVDEELFLDSNIIYQTTNMSLTDSNGIQPMNVLPNLVKANIVQLNKHQIRVQIQNIAIDTLDSAVLKMEFYNKSGMKILSPPTITESGILPGFWRNNDFYCNNFYKATLKIVARDGSQSMVLPGTYFNPLY